MRVETETITVTVYYFDRYEVTYLINLGVWDMLSSRLKSSERIEVE